MTQELAATKAELEALQENVADAEARATHLDSQLTQANEELEVARGESETREQDLTAQLRSAAERYREIALGRRRSCRPSWCRARRSRRSPSRWSAPARPSPRCAAIWSRRHRPPECRSVRHPGPSRTSQA